MLFRGQKAKDSLVKIMLLLGAIGDVRLSNNLQITKSELSYESEAVLFMLKIFFYRLFIRKFTLAITAHIMYN